MPDILTNIILTKYYQYIIYYQYDNNINNKQIFNFNDL